jgi:hypothetical protein
MTTRLTSKTRSFQMGVPSFDIGAAGATRLLDAESSFSLGSRGSFRLRIFLIETVVGTLLAGEAEETIMKLRLGVHTDLLVAQ